MKLYATTTSERASKGQGGNEYLNIDITHEDMQGNNIDICKLKIYRTSKQTDWYTIKYISKEGNDRILGTYELKGKQKKGDVIRPYPVFDTDIDN